MATRWKFRGSRGILCDILKIDGSLARNIAFEVANFQVLRKIRRKMSILKPRVKIGGNFVWNARLSAPTYFVSSRWFSCNLAVFTMLPWKLAEISYEMLVFLHPRVLSRVAVFLWCRLVYGGSWQTCPIVVMLFYVGGTVLCNIPRCLITYWKCRNYRQSRTKCWFFCIHVSCLESLVFLWRRRIYRRS